MPRDSLANLSKLPPTCLGILNDQVVTIARGAREAVPCQADRSLVDLTNHQNGITVHQRLAMENGILFGWNTIGADPDTHARALGDPVVKFRKYTVSTPYVKVVQVTASNETDALRLAESGEGDFWKDGPSMITEVEDV